MCAAKPTPGQVSERIEKTPSELVEVADQVVRRPEGRRPPVVVLHEMLSHTGVAEALMAPSTGRLPSAAEIFDSFAYGAPSSFREKLEQQFEVVALPGAPLRGGLQEADVLVRRGDGDSAHVSVIASSELRDFEGLHLAGLIAEVFGSGRYAQVVETGTRPHTREDQFARRVTESSGFLPQNTLVLRMRQPIGSAQSKESEAAFETSAQSSLHPDVETAGKRYRNGGSSAKNGHTEEAIAGSEAMGEGFGRRLLEDLLLLKLATPTPAAPPTVVKVEAPTGSATQNPQDFDSELSTEDELSCDHMDASQLSWPGASSNALDLMRRVYLRQTGAACQVRSFVADVPTSELAEIEKGVVARRDAAESCRRLLATARASLASYSAATSVSRIGVLSGYRSAAQQFTNWNRNFARYYSETQADRAALAGGEFGDASAALLTRYISLRLAVPGFSLHNGGRAVDFLTVDHGRTLGADTHASNRAAWRTSWFFQWLTDNANNYGFFQNTSIDEPWHWEFRSSSQTAPSQSIEGISWPLPSPDTTELVDVSDRGELAEAFPPGHRLELSQTPLLSSHYGTQPDLILRWNDAAESSNTLDVVVHLHGYSTDLSCMRLTNKEAYSGLDFSNPDSANASRGRTAPTLGILPRGSYTGDQTGANPQTYTFPALVVPSGIRDLIDYSLQQFQTAGGLSGTLSTGRLILTAHSGGGFPLMLILGNKTPDEIQIFDALYWDASPLISWVSTKISAEIQAWTPGKVRANGGLCILYRRRGTENQSLRVQQALRRAILRAPPDAQPVLQAAYRVLPTNVAHPEIARRFGWRLLADITADLSDAAGAPKAGSARVPQDSTALLQGPLNREETTLATQTDDLFKFAKWSDADDRRKGRNPRDQDVDGQLITTGLVLDDRDASDRGERGFLLANFKIDGARLRPEHRNFLDKIAQWMVRSRQLAAAEIGTPSARWLVFAEAHASRTGAQRHDDELSEDRYRATAAYLQNAFVQAGGNAGSITIKGEGTGFRHTPMPGEDPAARSVYVVIQSDPPPRPPQPWPPRQITPVSYTEPEDLTQEFLESIRGFEFENSSDIKNFFQNRTGMDFPAFFNRNSPLMSAWNQRIAKKKDEHGKTHEVLVPSAYPILVHDVAAFNRTWSLIEQFFGSKSINLIQFLALNSIITNETGGAFSPLSEKSQGLGIKYFMQYNAPGSASSSPMNIPAGVLFNSDIYLDAHGSLQPKELQRTTDPGWKARVWSASWPKDWTKEDYASNGFIMNADFYKYRGRGLIQTTFRANYKPLTGWIKDYAGADPVITKYKAQWAGMPEQDVLTRSTTLEWDELFMRTNNEIAAKAINFHNKPVNYLKLQLTASILNDTSPPGSPRPPRSLCFMGRAISGSYQYGLLFKQRVVQICNRIGNDPQTQTPIPPISI